MTKLILMRTRTTDEFGEADGYDYGLVRLDERGAKFLSSLLNLYRTSKDVHTHLLEMIFADDQVPCHFYPGEAFWDREGEVLGLTEEERDELTDERWIVLPDSYELPDPVLMHSPEEVLLNVNASGFFWTALPADAPYTIETEMPDPAILGQLI